MKNLKISLGLLMTTCLVTGLIARTASANCDSIREKVTETCTNEIPSVVAVLRTFIANYTPGRRKVLTNNSNYGRANSYLRIYESSVTDTIAWNQDYVRRHSCTDNAKLYQLVDDLAEAGRELDKANNWDFSVALLNQDAANRLISHAQRAIDRLNSTAACNR